MGRGVAPPAAPVPNADTFCGGGSALGGGVAPPAAGGATNDASICAAEHARRGVPGMSSPLRGPWDLGFLEFGQFGPSSLLPSGVASFLGDFLDRPQYQHIWRRGRGLGTGGRSMTPPGTFAPSHPTMTPPPSQPSMRDAACQACPHHSSFLGPWSFGALQFGQSETLLDIDLFASVFSHHM